MKPLLRLLYLLSPTYSSYIASGSVTILTSQRKQFSYNTSDLLIRQPYACLMNIERRVVVGNAVKVDARDLQGAIVYGRVGKATLDGSIDGWAGDGAGDDGFIDQNSTLDCDVVGWFADFKGGREQSCEVERQVQCRWQSRTLDN
ncbi:hypothetical protein EDD36DRAFT_230508 [Exophiala viscosa]|uniref:Dynactin subunit 6 n=1 Tax=Exophiala viscosa TaxID=2486360 RepID=A0AAN6DYN7_9EURO|nr:hypothetical protein EDD36DRAFT_230508 [Exophiala viscosa]